MSENSSKSSKKTTAKRPWWLLIALPVWVYVVFFAAQMVIGMLLGALEAVGVPLMVVGMVSLNALVALVTYIVALLVVISVPWYFFKRKSTAALMGVNDWPTTLEVLISPLAFVVYMLLTGVLVTIATNTLSVDVNQQQALPIIQTMLVVRWQYLVAFLTMVVLAPVAEELLFRGYLYGKLRNSFSPWLVILVVSVAFGAAHLWAGVDAPLQWAVAIDTFALSIVMCAAREYTGAIWVPIYMHMIKNGLAFYLLFINPEVINQIKSAALLLVGGN